VPGTNGAIFNQFLGNYQQRFEVNGNVFGSAGAYDTVFMLMFSASLVDGPARAEDLARGFRKLTSGLSVEVGSTYFGDGLNALAAGDSIDFVGASGALDFDNADEAASDIQVWCVTNVPDISNAGRFFNGSTMEGTTDPGDSVGLASYGVDDWPYAMHALDGKVALQVHSGGMALVQFKDIAIAELPPTPGAPTWDKVGHPKPRPPAKKKNAPPATAPSAK
jgi:hypothetical protein